MAFIRTVWHNVSGLFGDSWLGQIASVLVSVVGGLIFAAVVMNWRQLLLFVQAEHQQGYVRTGKACNTLLACMRTLVSAASRQASASGKRVLQKTELAEINNVSLPRLYHAIGKSLLQADSVPPELSSYRDKIRALEVEMAAAAGDQPAEHASGVVASVRRFTQQAAEKTASSVAKAGFAMKIHAAYLNAGRAAVKSLGESAIPPQLWQDLMATRKRRSELEADLPPAPPVSQVPQGGWTKGLVLLGLVMYFASWFFLAARRYSYPHYTVTGWKTFWDFAGAESFLANVCAASNVVAVASAFVLWRRPQASAQTLRIILAAIVVSVAAQLLLLYGLGVNAFRLGATLWFGSFIVFGLAARQRLLQRAATPEFTPSWGLRKFALACGCVAAAMVIGTTPINRMNQAIARQESAKVRERLAADERSRKEAAEEANEQAMVRGWWGLLQLGAAQRQQQDAANRRTEEIIQRMEQGKIAPRSYGGQAGGVNGGYQQQPRFQQWEGTCSRCGWQTGRQVTQQTHRCPRPSPPNGIPCGGAIVWRSVQ